jgi:DNA processing protein
VLAVPGPVDSPTSIGPHRLIQQGAKLVHEVGDILQELPRLAVRPPAARPAAVSEAAVSEAPPLPRPTDPLLPFLGSDPVQLEELVQTSRLPAHEVMSRLTMLELQGLIKELPGKWFVLDG